MTDSVRDYFNEIARYPLLTAEQEIQLARQIECGTALSSKQELSAQEKRVLRIAERAKCKLINCNLRLVVSVAKQYTRRLNGGGMELMDLVQEGALGLTRAVELFDSSKGYKFSTYAYWWIRQAITRAIDSKERLIRVPQHGLDKVYKVVRFQKAYMQKHGKMPSMAQMAEEADVEVAHMQTLLARNIWHRSLDDLVRDTGSLILDIIPDTDSVDRQKDYIEKDEKQAMFQVALSCLTESELFTIQRRYGLRGSEPMSLSSIAAEDGVSRERVRQRIAAAHVKMRVRLKAARLA